MMIVEVSSRPRVSRFFIYTGSNYEEFKDHIENARGSIFLRDGDVVTVQSDSGRHVVNPGDYVSAEYGTWGTQIVVYSPEEMDRLYFPASVLPKVTE